MRRENTGIDVVEWAQRGEECGAGEILLTSWGDGTKHLFDCILTSNVSQSTNVPRLRVGSRNTRTFLSGVLEGKADALLAASVFHYGELTIVTSKTI